MRTITIPTLMSSTDMLLGNSCKKTCWKIGSVFALCVSLTLGGCSMISTLTTNSAVEHEQVQNNVLDPVALDFARIIAQIDGLQPIGTTMRFYDETFSSVFNQSLGKAMHAAGYSVEKVSNPEVTNLVSHIVQQELSASDGEKYIYEVSVGEVKLRRGFVVSSNGEFMPATKMQVLGKAGVDYDYLKSDDSMY